MFDTDGSAYDAVMLAQYKANELQKPYAVVASPFGSLLTFPLDRVETEALEVVWPQN